MKKISMYLIFMGLGVICQAQEMVYRVLASQGDILAKNGMEVRNVGQGISLFTTEELILNKGAYLALLDVDGRTLELRSEGHYNIKELIRQTSAKGNSSAMTYAEYVINKMTEGKKNRLRSSAYLTGEGYKEGDQLHMYIPSMVKVAQESVLLQWQNIPEKEYRITIKNIFDKELSKTITSKNEFLINLNADEFAGEDILLVEVSLPDNEQMISQTYALKRLPDNQQEEIMSQLKQLSLGTSAPDYLVIAGYFEENNLLADALTNYVSAMRQEPEIEEYQDMYEEFLLRNHLLRF